MTESSVTSIGVLEADLLEKLLVKGYHIQQSIRSNPCAQIYLCDYTKLKETQEEDYSQEQHIRLACKVMDFVWGPRDFTKKFLPREIRITRKIRKWKIPHTNLVFSVLQYKSKIMLFSRYAENGTLAEYIVNNQRPLKEKLVKKWFAQLADAVDHLHKIGIAHRNITCEHILLTSQLNMRLTGFDFACRCTRRGKQTYSSTYCGTLGYAAPEVLKGIPYVPQLADIWSLGIVLFVMLNGAMPFPQKNPLKLHEAQVKKDYDFRPAVRSRISEKAVILISLMLQPSWFERITSEEIFSSSWLLEESALRRKPPNVALKRTEVKFSIEKLLQINLKSDDVNEILDELPDAGESESEVKENV